MTGKSGNFTRLRREYMRSVIKLADALGAAEAGEGEILLGLALDAVDRGSAAIEAAHRELRSSRLRKVAE